LRENKTWEQTEGWLKHVSTGKADVLCKIFYFMQVLRKIVMKFTDVSWARRLGNKFKREK
jgi:hypothetical protein